MNLTFENDTHTYKLDGVVIPSVTQVMKPLSEALYKSVDENILGVAAHRGSIVHESIEDYLNHGIDDIQPEYRGYLDAFKAFEHDYPFEVVGVEMRTCHGLLRYAGTVDLLCRIDGRLILIDYKTSARINEMLTGVQLEAYASALASNEIFVEDKAILHLKDNGKYTLKWYGKRSSESIAVFGACLTIYNHIMKFKEE